MPELKIRTKLIFSILSGTLTGAAYYPSYLLNTLTSLDINFGFLGFIAPFFFIFTVLNSKKLGGTLLYSFLFASFFTLNSLSWFSAVTFGGLLASSIIVGIFYMIVLGLPVFIFSRKLTIFTPFLFSISWVVNDYLFSIFPLRTPWGFVGYTSMWDTAFVQIADIFGVWGVTFLMIFIQSTIACAIQSFQNNKFALKSGLSLKQAILWKRMFLISMALLILAHVYGIFRIVQIDATETKGFTVALTQPSIPQGMRNEKYNFRKQIDTRMIDLFQAIEKAPEKIGEYKFPSPVFDSIEDIAASDTIKIVRLTDQPVQLIVDSETSFNYQFEMFDKLGEKYRFHSNVKNYIQTAKRNNWYMQISAVEEPTFPKPKHYPEKLIRGRNCSHLVSPSGNILGTYQKCELVPVGEFVPFLEYTDFMYSFIYNNVGRAQHFEPGKKFSIFEFPKTFNSSATRKNDKILEDPENFKFAVAICFESNFPYVNRELAKAGAKTIILHSNDGWFLETVEPEQIWTQARMRAIESRVGYLRAVNSGISGACDSLGRFIAILEQDGKKKGVAGALILEVPQGSANSLYVKLGDILPKSCLVIYLMSLFAFLMIKLFSKSKVEQLVK